MTSSTTAGSRSLRSMRARRGWAARSTACHPERRPVFLPTGVRTTSTITAFGMGSLLPMGRVGRKSGGCAPPGRGTRSPLPWRRSPDPIATDGRSGGQVVGTEARTEGGWKVEIAPRYGDGTLLPFDPAVDDPSVPALRQRRRLAALLTDL